MIDIPPGKYFISHSYKDAAIRDEMIAQLPPGVEPYIFPPIKVTPLEFVSSTLIGAILSCDGMIYLNEGNSARSFWVAFERDYALRSGKCIYAYTPSQKQLTLYSAPPLDLAVFSSYSHQDLNTIRPVLEFMKQSRYFDVWVDSERIMPGTNWVDTIEHGIGDTINRGGYVVLFWSDRESQSAMREVELGLQQGRVIVAGLGTRMPEFIMRYQDIFVQLIENGRLNNNRIDDLIVRLYWLIFRNQFPQLVYD